MSNENVNIPMPDEETTNPALKKCRLNAVHAEIFEAFGVGFDPDDESQVSMMSSIVFLIASIGNNNSHNAFKDYIFRLGPSGVRSEALLSDLAVDSQVPSADFADFVSDEIAKVKTLMLANPNSKLEPDSKLYSMTKWLKAAAAIIYLKRYVVPRDACASSVLSLLTAHCPDLYDDSENHAAYDACESIFGEAEYKLIVQSNCVKVKDSARFKEIIAMLSPDCNLDIRTLSSSIDTISRYGLCGVETRPGLFDAKHTFDSFAKNIQAILCDGEHLVIKAFAYDAKFRHMPVHDIYYIDCAGQRHEHDKANTGSFWE